MTNNEVALYYVEQALKYGIGKDVEKYILLEADLGLICNLDNTLYDNIFDLLETPDIPIRKDEVQKYFPYIYDITNFGTYKELTNECIDIISKSSRAKLAVLLCDGDNIFVDNNLRGIAQTILGSGKNFDIIPLVTQSHESDLMDELRWMVLVSGDNYLRENTNG